MNRIHGQKNSASERTCANIEDKMLTMFSGTVAVPLREDVGSQTRLFLQRVTVAPISEQTQRTQCQNALNNNRVTGYRGLLGNNLPRNLLDFF